MLSTGNKPSSKRVRFRLTREQAKLSPACSPGSSASALQSLTPIAVHPPSLHLPQRHAFQPGTLHPSYPPRSSCPAVHRTLRSYSHSGTTWNVMFPASPSSSMSEPATNPPLPSMNLTFRHSHHKFSIRPSNGQYVTVSDVLYGIHVVLHQPLPDKDIRRHARHGKSDHLLTAYHRRCNSAPHRAHVDHNLRQGYKLLDTFFGLFIFDGVSPSTSMPGVFYVDLR